MDGGLGNQSIQRLFSYPDPRALKYGSQQPFPHAIVANAWNDAAIAECKQQVACFEDWAGEKDFHGSRRKRYCGDIDRLPPAITRIIHEASTPAFLGWLEALTGEQALLPDPYLEGGGIHQIAPGGFLKVHADFNWNQRLRLYRRLNVLLYLNPDWRPEWGGELELWPADLSACSRRVPPMANTMVVFTTDDRSYHGHPQPLACPDGVTRDSIALYYYSAIKPTQNHAYKRKTTDYRSLGDDAFDDGGWRRRLRRRWRAWRGK